MSLLQGDAISYVDAPTGTGKTTLIGQMMLLAANGRKHGGPGLVIGVAETNQAAMELANSAVRCGSTSIVRRVALHARETSTSADLEFALEACWERLCKPDSEIQASEFEFMKMPLALRW